jgi:hypothetical protein
VICSSGIGFDPHHNGQRLTFGFHGIWQGVAVLYDKQTRSLWMHLTGECIDGPLEGAALNLITGRHVLWREWKRDQPSTRVMAADAKFQGRYFSENSAKRGNDFFPQGFRPTIDDVDDRLPPSALCYGIKTETATRAYPFAALIEAPGGVVNGHVGETPVVILFDADTRSAAAHGRRVGDKTLILESTDDGRLVDVESGSRFDRDGRCIEGPLRGQRLSSIVGVQAEWYGWRATHPDTTVYPDASLSERDPGEDR